MEHTRRAMEQTRHAPATAPAPARERGRGRRVPRRRSALPLGDAVRRRGLAVVCVALFAAFGAAYDYFATVDNVLAVGLNVSSLAIAATGAALLLISGHVDLSVGSMYALVAVIAATVARDTQSTAATIAVGLGAGLLLGLCNGLLTRALRINPLIVTLGLLMVYSGAAYVVSRGVSVSGLPDGVLMLGRARLAGIPAPILVALGIMLGLAWFVRNSVWGLRVYALGGNLDATRARGVDVDRMIVGLYTLNGALIGVVALLGIGRLGSATPQLGVGFELDVLTAVILGGVAFTGGSGRATGVAAGIATIGVLNAGLVFMGMQDWWQNIARGGVLLLALAADQVASRRRARATPTLVHRLLRRTWGPDASDDATTGHATTGHGAPDHDTRDASGTGEPPRVVDALARGRYAGQGNGNRATVLRCRDLAVRYGSVVALRNGSIDVAAGEVTCLVGDNGAGKSTLVKAISGIVRPSAGTIEVDGRAVDITGPAAARALGIETVYQDLALCPNLGIVHNLVLGDEPRRRLAGLPLLRDDRAALVRARERLDMLSVQLDDLTVPVRLLSGGQRQSVAISRALRSDVKVVILDEPTAALGVAQARNVLELVRRIADAGAAVVMISHDIETVFAIADRVVVLRLGDVVHDGAAGDLAEGELLHLMAGLTAPPAQPGDHRPPDTRVEEPAP